MPTITISTWVDDPAAEGYYAFAGPAPSLYPYRGGPFIIPPATVEVPTDGLWYVALCSYRTITDDTGTYEVLSPPSTEYPVTVSSGDAPIGVCVMELV